MSDHEHLLAALTQQVERLAEAGGTPLRRVKIQAGEVVLEAVWDAGSTHAPGTATLPVVVQQPGEEVGGHGDGEPAPASMDGTVAVRAPTVGVFYRAPEPGATPFVEVRDVVAAGQQLAILEAMKLMNPIEAETPGRVVQILVPDGSPVEYDQPLFVLEPYQ